MPHWSLLHTTNSLLQSFAISSQSTTLSLIPLHIPSFHSPSPHSATHPSFCYPSSHSATHPLILLPIPSFCYPSPHFHAIFTWGWGSDQSRSHINPWSGGCRFRSSARTSSRVTPSCLNRPPCITWDKGRQGQHQLCLPPWVQACVGHARTHAHTHTHTHTHNLCGGRNHCSAVRWVSAFLLGWDWVNSIYYLLNRDTEVSCTERFVPL